MPRSSELVAALASALAKAQADLVNPEKSQTATIRLVGQGRGRADLPLCAAVERPRHRPQGLSQHEIATLQTTGVDQAGGLSI